MGHRTGKDHHHRLQERLDRMPVGAPGRQTIREILLHNYTAEEAEFAARLPLRFSSLKQLSQHYGLPEAELRLRLERLADKGLVFDLEVRGELRYTLNPTIVGFIEFSMMRVRDDLDQKALAQLYHRYLLEEPDFAKAFDPATQTSLFRTLVHEEALPRDFAEILDWERATHLVETASSRAVSLCHCRHVAHHLDRDCTKMRMECCLTLGPSADYVVRHGMGRSIDVAEAKDLLAETRDAGLVHIADNVQNNPAFICNCCGCCCELLGAFKEFRMFAGTFSSNYEPFIDEAQCNACRSCERACPVEAVKLERRPHEYDGKTIKFTPEVDDDICLGCGVCALQCETGGISMVPREQRHITPTNTFARILTMAIEQGKLQEILFDQTKGMPSQVAGVIVGAILSLPPAKQLLARQEVRSRFVDFLLDTQKRSAPARPN
jgi:Pyruvate/2-oxoacid:ferredoxin oxidoreductase delta subunit